MKSITAASAGFIIASNRIAVRLNYEMVALCTDGITTPPNDTTLVAINGSGSGDVVLDDVETDDSWAAVVGREVADAEKDLPGEQVGEKRGRGGKEGVLGEEGPDGSPERLGGEGRG